MAQNERAFRHVFPSEPLRVSTSSSPERIDWISIKSSTSATWLLDTSQVCFVIGAEAGDYSLELRPCPIQGETYRACRRIEAGVIEEMTLHASKGLEFPVVAVMGARQAVAGEEVLDKGDDALEEMRLFYVGATRATSRLIVANAIR